MSYTEYSRMILNNYVTSLILGFSYFALNLQTKKTTTNNNNNNKTPQHQMLYIKVHHPYMHVSFQQYLWPPDKPLDLLNLKINLALYRHFLLLLNFKLWFRSAHCIVFHSVVIAHANLATSLKIENYIAELIENLLMVHGGVSSN